MTFKYCKELHSSGEGSEEPAQVQSLESTSWFGKGHQLCVNHSAASALSILSLAQKFEERHYVR